jgi:hypothetical protein
MSARPDAEFVRAAQPGDVGAFALPTHLAEAMMTIGIFADGKAGEGNARATSTKKSETLKSA